MSKPPTWLLDHGRNVHTKSGEDGIIEKILETFPKTDKWCVEFGAWDGIARSNTRHLIEGSGYSAVLIEASPSKFAELQRNNASNNSVRTINAFVGFGEVDGLDALLAKTPVPRDYDFASIDVDGNDYHIWKASHLYRPKAVCIEFNPTIPTEVSFVQEADPSVTQGSSLLAFVELGKEKGYELVAVTDVNAFFVDASLFPLFEIDDNRPQTLRRDLRSVTYLFSGYDGTVFLRGLRQLRWHEGLPLRESAIQHLPRFLRKYPGNYSGFERAAFWTFVRATSPWQFTKRVFRKLGRLAGR